MSHIENTDKADEREAFCHAALECKERLWSFSLQLTRNHAEAEDLLQLTYVRGFERWEQLRELDRIASWLLRIMHRAFVDRCRRKTCVSMESLEVVSEAHPPVARASGPHERTMARDSVVKALDQLAPVLAQALALRDVWGFSYNEISELMDCPIGTVRSRIARARSQMLDHLASTTDDVVETDRLGAAAGGGHES